jgi:hypothetical protein
MSADPNHRPASCDEFVADLTNPAALSSDDLDSAASDEDVWYLLYTNSSGIAQTTSGSTRSLRQSIKAAEFGDLSLARASRSKVGPFEELYVFPEFRDLIVQPAPGPPLSERSSSNLEKLARLQQAAAEKTPHLPTASPLSTPTRSEVPGHNTAVPHFRLTDHLPSSGSDHHRGEWGKAALYIVIALLTTIAASKYILPLFLK